MSDRSELLFDLVGAVGRGLQHAIAQWDGFAVIARFGGSSTVNTWYYMSGDNRARETVSDPATLPIFEALRDSVEVLDEPVKIGILTYVRTSGSTDLQMLSENDGATKYAVDTSGIGQMLRPGELT